MNFYIYHFNINCFVYFYLFIYYINISYFIYSSKFIFYYININSENITLMPSEERSAKARCTMRAQQG